MAADPRIYRDPVHAIGSPEDSKATDSTSNWSMIALLKAILGSVTILQPRVITAAGGFTMLATDTIIVLNKAAPSATPIQLLTFVGRNRPLLIVDFAGNAGDITITPATGEKIMGLAANAPWVVGSGGAGLGGSVTLTPVATVGILAT